MNRYKYNIIGVTFLDESEDGFYLHQNDPELSFYKNKPELYGLEIIGSVEETFEVYQENPGI